MINTETQKKYLNPKYIATLKNLELKAKTIVEGFITGLHKSPYHGFSVEFSEYKPYNKGEDLKTIDWKLFAKTDKLFSKKYEEETNLRCYLLVDVSDSMRYPTTGLSKLEYSIYLAAALSYLMINQKDAVSLTLFNDKITKFLPPKALNTWTLNILYELDKELQNKELFTHRTATHKILYELAPRLKQRGLIILISDLFNPENTLKDLLRGLKYLKHNKHEVIIFNVVDKPTEIDFQLPNSPVILKDLETAETLKINPLQIRENYKRKVNSFFSEIKKQCLNWQIDFVEADINQPYDKVLLKYLIKRMSMTNK